MIYLRAFIIYFTSLSQLTALQAKVHYLRYLSELKLYGGREFQSILLVRTYPELVAGIGTDVAGCGGFIKLLTVVAVTHYVARGETDGGDAAGGAPLRHQSCHQHTDQPGGPVGRFQPRQPHRDPDGG